jgi:Transglutaminase-like superfamily
MAVQNMTGDPVDICWPVHSLVIQPGDAEKLRLPATRFATNQMRPANDLILALLALDQHPLNVPRKPERRIVGTCRHFAVLACALLRHHGVAARVRCGFATYFQPGQGLDHWIVEYQNPTESGWIRVDPEILGSDILGRATHLARGDFLSGGEAWLAYRQGEIDGASFGVYGTQNWGPAEIRGNAVKDLAALNKVEMLPWDEWGRMTEAYDGKTGADYDELLDQLAAVCAADDPALLAAMYIHPDLAVPPSLSR